LWSTAPEISFHELTLILNTELFDLLAGKVMDIFNNIAPILYDFVPKKRFFVSA
jgi:hypothetical protein